MTQLGKIIITAGIVIFTLGALMWIAKDNWQYFAGGAAIFVGCILSGIVLSIETKTPNNNNHGNGRFTHTGIPYRPPVREERETKLESTDPYPTTPIPTSGNWSPPTTPPPDQESDPFYGKKTDA